MTLSPAERARRAAVRADVTLRDGRCLLDHLPDHACFGRATVHHLRKASQGGPYEAANLVALCAAGNDDVEDRPDRYRALGLVVAKGVDAAEARRRRVDNGLVPYPRGNP